MAQLPQWLQLNIGLTRQNGNALPSARAVFAEIQPLIDRWRAFNFLNCCFFMRKPPDIRMRFLMTDSLELAMSELSTRMAWLKQQNLIECFSFSTYEPEVDRFGGLAAMDIVHQYFDCDTTHWLALDQLAQNNFRSIPPELLLATVFHNLFCQIFEDDTSILRVWQSLAELTPLSIDSEIPEVKLLTIEELCDRDSTTELEANILHRYCQAHRQFAEDITQLELLGNLHNILATTALFNFNRHGFPGERSSAIVADVIQALA